ncbi:MAG: Ig-like domain-containing protein [Bacteroidales bacterium]|nr:Ig-like domain-containing protein [Bacteroidales bacterium]
MNAKLTNLTKSALAAAALSGLMLTSCGKDDANVIINKVEEHSEITSQVQTNQITNFIKLNGESKFVLDLGETAQITEGDSFDNIYSQDSKVATVDASGKITAVSYGATKVIVAAGNQVLREYTVAVIKDGLLVAGTEITNLTGWYYNDRGSELRLYFEDMLFTAGNLHLVTSIQGDFAEGSYIDYDSHFCGNYNVSFQELNVSIKNNSEGVPVIYIDGVTEDGKFVVAAYTLSEDNER